MKNNPFVSIIMPVYNCDKDIETAIKSVQNQTMQEWELIIVDDCSTDETCDVVKKYAKDDSRIILIEKEENSGPGNSKNRGIAIAKGQYITFCDGDDWVEECMLVDMSMNQAICEDVIIAGYYRDLYDVDGNLQSTQLVSTPATAVNEKSEIILNIPKIDQSRLFSFAWNKLYKKGIITSHQIGFSDKRFGEDYDFNIAFFEHVSSMRIMDKGYYHYIKKNSESLTERYVPDFFEINKDRFLRMKKLMERHNVYLGEIQGMILTAYIKHVLSAITRLNDQRAGLSGKEKRQYVDRMLKDEMSLEAVRHAKANSMGEKLCNMIFKTHSTTINMMFGKALWFMQTKGKKVFEKMKG